MDVATRRLHIGDLRADDLTAMIELWTDADVGRFMGTYGPRSAEETATGLEDTVRHNRAQPRFAHNAVIIVTETGECAGWSAAGRAARQRVTRTWLRPAAGQPQTQLRPGSHHRTPRVLPR